MPGLSPGQPLFAANLQDAGVVLNLLATGKQTPPEDRLEEGELIAAALRALPPQRAFRVLELLRERRIVPREQCTSAALRSLRRQG